MRAALLTGVLAAAGGAVLACGGDGPTAQKAPEPVATVTIQGPATVTGLLANDTATTRRRYSYSCSYRVSAAATGPAGASAQWAVARMTTTFTGVAAVLGGTPRVVSDTLPADQLQRVFGSATLTPAASATAGFGMRVVFDSGPEPRGVFGANRTHWEFDYVSAGQTRTATYDVECTPAVVQASLGAPRPGGPVAFGRVTLDARAWVRPEAGIVRPELPVGRHGVVMDAPRLAPRARRVGADAPKP